MYTLRKHCNWRKWLHFIVTQFSCHTQWNAGMWLLMLKYASCGCHNTHIISTLKHLSRTRWFICMISFILFFYIFFNESCQLRQEFTIIGWASDSWNTLTVYGILFIYQLFFFLTTFLFFVHRFLISQRKLFQVTPLGWDIEVIFRFMGKA